MTKKQSTDTEIRPIPAIIIGIWLILLIVKLLWGLPIDWFWAFSPIWIALLIIVGVTIRNEYNDKGNNQYQNL